MIINNMDKNYYINESSYLNPTYHYYDSNYFPEFQKNFEIFKNNLKSESKNRIAKTYYKFGDGDYYILSKEKVGTSKPGLRDLKKKDDLTKNPKLYEQILKGSKLNDYYMAEIKFLDLFKKVFPEKEVRFPAEFAYGIISSKWVFKNFDKIGLIGSAQKLQIIKKLIKFEEYKNYLGIDNFEDYIEIPQVYALSKSDQVYNKIKKNIEKSRSEIFLLGIGHVQNTILYKLKESTSVPLLCVGVGIDAISGLIDIRRPYFGNWKNYQLKDASRLYSKVLDPVMKTTNDSNVIRYLG